ncbi:NnrU family protein [Lentisalinibacter sediminis]|uniref:NnrU family protein n=1 Tax=Lentisalinibacter sediminis TaxID=2992237 RepID=UPI00386BD331
MALLILGLVLFLGIHSSSIVAEGFRDRMAAKSELGWKAFYGIVSIVGIVLIVKGYADARMNPTLLYVPPVWMKHLAALLLLPVFILFFAPYFPGKIKAATKHPQLVAVKLWAVAHLLVNGTLADVILFGSFLIWAVVDRISFKRRVERPVPAAPAKGLNDVLVVAAGLGVYVIFTLWLHEAWFGVAPFG